MIQHNPNSGRGFTLVELTVVLLLISLLATVSMRETAEFNFQTRYEQTRERLEMIKQAILGNPKQLINGQQVVSGFVADMGRLPFNLRELLTQCSDGISITQANCATNGFAWQPSLTTIGSCATGAGIIYNTQADCSLAGGTSWLAFISAGWRGPYLSLSGSPSSSDALTDGWGRTSTDSNYGWKLLDWNTLLPPLANTSNLIIQSLGKDQALDQVLPAVNPAVENYDNDYPANIYLSAGGVVYPNPAIRLQDWKVDVSNGISVSFIKSTRALPNISFCDDTSKTIKTACVAPATWYGGCSKASYYNTASCTAASGLWTSCSDGSSPKATCLSTIGNIWYGNGFGCSDQSKTTQILCVGPATWNSCSDGTSTTLALCLANSEIWYGADIFTINIPIPPPLPIPICMKVFYRKTDSSIGVLVSDEKTGNDTPTNGYYDPKLITADGSAQTIKFTNFRDATITTDDFTANFITNIPIGTNAIGIYQYDGTSCSTTTLFYPADRQNPIQVDFHPNATLPVINC